jgi:tetratricopeptide (TPR) repeat protein
MNTDIRKTATVLFIGIGMLCSLLTGCGQKSGAQLDAADEKDARVSKGLDQVRQKNWDEAIGQFESALVKKPELGRPDLELAMIYHQHEKNYARAIYHYERYLEKRPLTEKRALIQDWIKQAKISLAGETGLSGGDVSQELIRLTRENNLLRRQLETAGGAAPVLSANVKTILTQPPAPRPVPAQTAAPVAPKPARTYQVRPGDTLSRVAGSVYGDAGKWQKIYDANRDKMKTETDIKVGQTLIIPNP